MSATLCCLAQSLLQIVSCALQGQHLEEGILEGCVLASQERLLTAVCSAFRTCCMVLQGLQGADHHVR